MVAAIVDPAAFAILDGLWWLLLLLGPLLILQRSLHREIQAVFLLVTRRDEISLALFSILFFPGILLHEGSHYLMARVLGVRTGRFSLLPRPLADGRLQLGFVETSATDIFRDALIGIAPLLAGGCFVAYAGLSRLGLTSLWGSLVSGDTAAMVSLLSSFHTRPDFWLWFYLAFAASSTMLPSRSDRRAWVPLALMFALLLGGSLLAGAGPWLLGNLAAPFNQFLRAVAIVFGISAALHLVLLLPLWILHRLLSRVTGLDVSG
jgi:hypothetical protein